MIFIWNRKEVYSGYSMEKSSKIRSILSTNGIKYICKTINRNNGSLFDSNRARVGTMNENSSMSYEYCIYVHKDDFDNAKNLIYKIK